jgi:SSS family solute:Na+ symporter
LGYPVLGIWYWCCDQTIVQRVLAARDEKHARLGPLFCAALKVLPVFFFVLPGVICVALVQQGFFQNQSVSAPPDAKVAYAFMVTHMLPWGLKGLVTAAMLAAAMQTCSAALNSTATLVAYDVLKRYRPQTSDHRLVVVGKITTVAGTILAIISSPIFAQKDTVFQALTDVICYISPPITAVFLFGVFWKRASGWAAFLALIVGNAIGFAIFFLDMFKQNTGWDSFVAWHLSHTGMMLNSMMACFYLFVICSVIIVVASFVFPQQLKEEAKPLVWEDWREPLRGESHGRGLGNYRVFAAAVTVVFVVLYIVFW